MIWNPHSIRGKWLIARARCLCHYACHIPALFFLMSRLNIKDLLGTSHQWQQADQVTKSFIVVRGYIAERAQMGSLGSGSQFSSILPTSAVWPDPSPYWACTSSSGDKESVVCFFFFHEIVLKMKWANMTEHLCNGVYPPSLQVFMCWRPNSWHLRMWPSLKNKVVLTQLISVIPLRAGPSQWLPSSQKGN